MAKELPRFLLRAINVPMMALGIGAGGSRGIETFLSVAFWIISSRSSKRVMQVRGPVVSVRRGMDALSVEVKIHNVTGLEGRAVSDAASKSLRCHLLFRLIAKC